MLNITERRWPFNIATFTADGTLQGLVTIADASGWYVKQKVNVVATGKKNLDLEVKRVISPTQFFVGPSTGDIDSRIDVSQYTVALAAQITAAEQERPNIRQDFVLRHVYAEEPIVALRVLQVDKFGSPIGGGGGVPSDINVQYWGGVATSLGQKPMASSVPVTIASNQSPLDVVLDQTAAVPQSSTILASAITGSTAGTANTVITLSGDKTFIYIKNTLNKRVNLTIGALHWLALDNNESGAIDLGSNAKKILSGQAIKVFYETVTPDKGSLFISLV